MTIKKLTTNNENLLFIGFDGHEEFYLKMDSDFKGWSFMGLRPQTEEYLRSIQRETDPDDFFDMPSYMAKYFDYDKFADDREEQWEEYHDVQAEREDKNGETLYLGFGTGTDIKHYFKQNGIVDFESFEKHFEFIGLDKKEFTQLKNKVKF